MVRFLLLSDNSGACTSLLQILLETFADVQVTRVSDAHGLSQAVEANHFDLAILDWSFASETSWLAEQALLGQLPDCPLLALLPNGDDPGGALSSSLNEVDATLSHDPADLARLPSLVRSLLEGGGEREPAPPVAEDLYRRLVEFSPEMIVVYDETEVLYINPAGAKLFGGDDPRQFLGRPIADFFHPEQRGEFQEAIGRLIETGEVLRRAERALKLPDGQVRHVEISSAPVLYHGRPARQAVVRDVSERKRAVRRLAYQAHLLANVHDAIIATDHRFRITAWNQAAERLYGWTADDVLGRNVRDVLPALTEDQRVDALQTLAETGELQLELTQRRKDGAVIYVEGTTHVLRDAQGNISGYVSVNRDISERHKAEEALRRHSERLEALAEISKAMARATLEIGDVLDAVVRRVARLMGDACVLALFEDEGPQLSPLSFYHPDPRAREVMERVYSAPPLPTEGDVVAPLIYSGKTLLLPELSPEKARQMLPSRYWPYVEEIGLHSLLIVPLRAQGEVIGTLGVTRDSPGQPYSEEDQTFLQNLADRAALTIANARLFERERQRNRELRELGTRLTEVDEARRQELARELHDRVGQSLTALSINVNVIRALLESGDDGQRVAERLDDSQELVEQTVAHMRDIMAELRPAVLDDYGLLAALRWYGNQFAARTGISTTVHGDPLSARLSPEKESALFRIAQEALTNVARHAQADEVAVRLQSTAQEVRLTLADDGIGFDPENVVNAGALSGWGLRIMRERAATVGGTFQVESTPGAGTRVIVEVSR